MILSCHHISKAFLEEPVLSDITFHLEKGDKAAIVGANGAGKSTLLKIMVAFAPLAEGSYVEDTLTPDEGTVAYAKDVTLGYLAQNQNLNSANTIYDEVLSVKKHVIELEQKIARSEQMMGRLQGAELDDLMTEYNQLLHIFQLENGYAYKGEITGVLRGLGFDESEFSQRISTLSGGQKTRVALAKLLLEKPDIIILDEPTNHLDITSIAWLENYLLNYRGTVLIVSHDRYFLDKIVSRVIEIENTRATLFTGNYSAYAERKKALREEAWHQYLNNQAQIRHQEEVIAKLRQFNREKSIKRAESREKMLSKMERTDRPVELRDDMHLVLKPCIKSGRDVMQVRHLAKSFDGKELFNDIGFEIRRGDHAALIGSNGSGKTTILRIINGLVAPDAGAVRFGTNVHVGYYDQEHHVLNDSNTVFEEISDAHPDMTNTEIRSLLASFLFTGDDVFKLIGDLSGGEKGRVSLAKLMLSEANFLILDEPTNHLDMVSREVLENALNSYEGTVLYVSHDRYFINRTASRILNLTQNVLVEYNGSGSDLIPEKYYGNYDYYLEKSQQIGDQLISRQKSSDAGTPGAAVSQTGDWSDGPSAAETAGRDDWARQKQEQARLRKAASEIKKLEERITALEEKNSAIEETMALPEVSVDIERLSALSKEHEENDAQLAALYEQWEQLQEAQE